MRLVVPIDTIGIDPSIHRGLYPAMLLSALKNSGRLARVTSLSTKHPTMTFCLVFWF
jgi:hypothetical protein